MKGSPFDEDAILKQMPAVPQCVRVCNHPHAVMSSLQEQI